ncbi:MAG TPA: phage tail protein [Roseivirga sp.]
MEGTLGEIRIFAGNFAPMNWAFCHGQMLTIMSNPALFSLIGNHYGGDGRTNFALPDLRGKVIIGADTSNLGSMVPLLSEPQDNLQVQGLAINYIICINGMFPTRA